MIIIAGSGPSIDGYEGPVDIATKKTHGRDCRYVFIPSPPFAEGVEKPILSLRHGGRTIQGAKNGNLIAWRSYYKQFKPCREKLSSASAAAVCAYEFWGNTEFGFIGCDSLMDRAKENGSHDWKCEFEMLRSLFTITDLRDGKEYKPWRRRKLAPPNL